MGCLPLWDGFGMICALLGTMFAAATLVLLPRFNAHTALKTIAAQHVTVFEGEPDMYPAMLGAANHYGLDFTSLRVCMSAGRRCRWTCRADSKTGLAASSWTGTN